MTSELYLHIFTFSGRNRQRGHFDHRNKFNVYKYSAVDCVRPFAKEEIKTPNKVLLEMYENLLIVEVLSFVQLVCSHFLWGRHMQRKHLESGGTLTKKGTLLSQYNSNRPSQFVSAKRDSVSS